MTDRRVILAVSAMLGVLALVGMVCTFLLLADGNPEGATAMVGLAAAPTTALAMLATRGTPQVAAAESEAVGYRKAVADVASLAPVEQTAGVVAPAGPAP